MMLVSSLFATYLPIISNDPLVMNVRAVFSETPSQIDIPHYDTTNLEQKPCQMNSLELAPNAGFESNSLISSAFAVDLTILFNDTEGISRQFLARYASFSPILNVKLRRKYVLLNSTACSSLHGLNLPEAKGKIVIVQRGECPSVSKVRNLLDAQIDLQAIIIANNEAHRGLETMYTTNFNDDGLVTIPILFMTLEDFENLKKVQEIDGDLVIQIASIDGLFGMMLLIALSPTLFVVMCYLTLKCLKHFKKRTLNARYKNIVQNLPVYFFFTSHLVPATKFAAYVGRAHELTDLTLELLLCDDVALLQELEFGNSINESTLHSMKDLNLLFADQDYFRTQKCLICLGRYIPLKSRVLVLNCGHIYHKACLSNWLVNFRRSCPLCNENLNLLEQITPAIRTYDGLDFDQEADVAEFSYSAPSPHILSSSQSARLLTVVEDLILPSLKSSHLDRSTN